MLSNVIVGDQKEMRAICNKLSTVQFYLVICFDQTKFMETMIETSLNFENKVHLITDTKVPLDIDDISTDILGVSAVIVNDLKQKRTHDYDFDWDKALDVR